MDVTVLICVARTKWMIVDVMLFVLVRPSG